MSNLQKFITVLIGAIAGLLPILMLQVHWVLGVVGDIAMIFVAGVLNDPKYKGKDTEIMLAAVLLSIVCQIAWALVA